jgi:predicted dehydrogenase
LEIVLAALDAGKHVYCEAPLANSVEDCKTIARAAQKAYRQVFQAGLQERSHPQRHFLRPFVRSGALGRNVMARSQWRQKTSWARTHANDDRAKELNWRLRNATSTGLMGENCVHLLDAVCWFLGGWPNSVTGHSSLIQWNDGRDVPDTVQCILEFPDGPNAGLRFFCDATLCSSFESIYEVYYGTDSSVLVRDSKAWMFKEPDAPFLGWEGYARKDSFGAEVGVALVADASKQSALAKKDAAPPPFSDTPLHYALEAFTWNAGNLSKALGDYVDSYGDADSPELRANLDEARKSTQKQHPAAGWREGLEATVIAIKANEAAFGRQKLALPPSLFET